MKARTPPAADLTIFSDSWCLASSLIVNFDPTSVCKCLSFDSCVCWVLSDSSLGNSAVSGVLSVSVEAWTQDVLGFLDELMQQALEVAFEQNVLSLWEIMMMHHKVLLLLLSRLLTFPQDGWSLSYVLFHSLKGFSRWSYSVRRQQHPKAPAHCCRLHIYIKIWVTVLYYY